MSEHLDEEDHLEDDLVSLHLGQEDKLCNFDNGDYVELDESDIESDDLEYKSDLKTNLNKDDTTTQSVEKTSDNEEEVFEEEKELDDDNNKQKPQFIPRQGLFYEHDNRNGSSDDPGTDQEGGRARMEREKRKKGKEIKWEHDKFIELEQLLRREENVSDFSGSKSNVARSERYMEQRLGKTSKSLKGKKSFENINSLREKEASETGRLLRENPGSRRREKKGPKIEVEAMWGGQRSWGQNINSDKFEFGQNGRRQGGRGGWAGQVNRVRVGDEPWQKDAYKSSPSVQGLESKARAVPVKYSNQRRENPRKLRTQENSEASQASPPPTMALTLDNSPSTTRLNINAAVFESSMRTFQSYPLQQLHFTQEMPEKMSRQHNLPGYFPGFDQKVDPQSFQHHLVGDPMQMMATVGFLDGFPNQGLVTDPGNAFLGFHNLGATNFFDPINRMITPHAS